MLKSMNRQILYRIFLMSMKRLNLMVLLLVIGCQQVGVSAKNPAAANSNNAASEVDKQLEINKGALLNGPSEEIRVNAATLMLTDENPVARQILLDVLKQTENRQARMSVLRVLIQIRTSKEELIIQNKADFIEPLFSVISGDDTDIAKLAAEAALMFDYEQISGQLDKMLSDKKLGAKAKSNLIYALRVRPDKKAMFKLMELLDHKDKQIAGQAQKTLVSMGIPVGKSAEERKRIENELNRKTTEDFLRDWEIRLAQEDRMRQLQKELDEWQERHLVVLDKLYNMSNDAAQVEVLVESLASSKSPVRLWALEKVDQWRKGTKPEIPAKLGEVLVGLVSDSDRNVRFETAKLLSVMTKLNSAEKLLGQINVEKDQEVRMEMFVALGGACHYALQPDAGVAITPEIRKQTLELAVKYLFEQEAKKTQKGAEVIRKLLERNGLTVEEVDKYLGMLAERYKQQKDSADGKLRGELLSEMAELCGQSVHKAKSAALFKLLFVEGLADTSELVREAAVDGLIYIDKTDALRRFRKDLALLNDSDVKIRSRIISLTGEVGDKEDLDWLSQKMGATAEGESAWQTMLKIFKLKDTDAAVLNGWLGKFGSSNSKLKLSDNQMLLFLQIAERKALSEKNTQMLKDVRSRLVDIYKKSGEFDKAAEYLGFLRESAGSAEEKEAISVNQLDVYLKGAKIKAATDLVGISLLEGDLDPNSRIVGLIDDYLANLPAGVDANSILTEFTKLESPEGRVKWQAQLKKWVERFGRPKKVDKPVESTK